MDGDFPVVLPNGGAFLDGFMRRRGFVFEQESGQPAQTLSFESQQMLGGPEIGQIAINRSSLPAISKASHPLGSP